MNKILLYTFALCLVLNSVVDSCQSNSAASSYCVGAFSDSCNDQCRCNATSLLTCIDFKCGCNLASLGDLESTCNDICQCKTNTGLSCLNSRCSCNTTTQVWDTIKCYNTESTTTNCDKLIQATPNFVSGSSSAFTATTKALKNLIKNFLFKYKILIILVDGDAAQLLVQFIRLHIIRALNWENI